MEIETFGSSPFVRGDVPTISEAMGVKKTKEVLERAERFLSLGTRAAQANIGHVHKFDTRDERKTLPHSREGSNLATATVGLQGDGNMAHFPHVEGMLASCPENLIYEPAHCACQKRSF